MADQGEHRSTAEKNALFELILENAGDVLWIYDFHKDRYTYASPSVFTLRGFTPDEILQQSLYDALVPESAERALKLVTERINKLESGDMSARFGVYEFEQYRKDGTTVMTEVMTTFVTNNDGRVTGIVGIARDISERLEEEKIRKEIEKKLYDSQRLEAINRIVGGVAHELNNTLTPITGYAELLTEIFDSKPEPLEYSYSQQIHESAQKATRLIDQLLDYTSSQHLKLKFIDLNNAVLSFEHLLRSVIRENIAILLQHDGSGPCVRMDLEKLRQIIINLAFNAQDAMPEGGTLTLDIRTVKLGKAEADELKILEGQYAEIVVRDTGAGIDASVQPKIFEPFFTTKSFGIASGLGLSAVYGIVMQHKGLITVDSEVGKGTSVTIILPLYSENELEPLDPAAQTIATGGRNKTIMLVEDDDNVRELVEQILSLQGHTVLEASNSSIALELTTVHAGTIDLLVTDIIMPGMNGKQLADEMLKLYPSIKTLFISGYSNNIITENVQMPPKCHFMQKPFSYKEFNQLVQRLLDEP